MNATLSSRMLVEYLRRQLDNHFPDSSSLMCLDQVVSTALTRVEICFSAVSMESYSANGDPFLNHLNADHYTIFLYYCSNTAFNLGETKTASKLFYLNKVLHSFHCMYDTILPDIFVVVHGVGTVLGKATYNDYFVVTQGCTVGANGDHQYPVIEDRVIMYPNSLILGDSHVHANTVVANNSVLLNVDIPANSLAFGVSPSCSSKPSKSNRIGQFFKFSEVMG
jgi:serine O-acetyltransferase|tara:strand:- start:2403 stop:3071 length:669 start_codon:yes stop_codon:yes gene_type:complete